jgi:hypothetical protein
MCHPIPEMIADTKSPYLPALLTLPESRSIRQAQTQTQQGHGIVTVALTFLVY